jgi:hypothetical protein
MKGEEATSGRLSPWHDGGRVARGGLEGEYGFAGPGRCDIIKSEMRSLSLNIILRDF